MVLPMPTVSKDGLAQIRKTAISVHKSLYCLERIIDACCPFLPRFLRDALEGARKCLHDSLQALREVMLENLDIEELTEEEVKILGGGQK